MKIHLLRASLLLLQVILLSGCATQALWSDKQAYQYAPAPDPGLELFLAQNSGDVLVRYNELQRRDLVRRRAYFLESNLSRVEAGRKPHFVDAAVTNGMAVIKVIEAPTRVAAMDTNDLYAVHQPPSHTFALYSRGEEVIAHHLPVYTDKVDRTGRVLLTPLAVVTDVTLFSAAVGFVAWVESGLPPLTEQSRGSP